MNLQSISNTLAGMLFFLASWAFYVWFTADANSAAPVRPFMAKSKQVTAVRFFAPGRAWKQAVIWKDFHFHAGGVSSILAQCLIFMVVLLIACVLQLRYDRQIAWEANAFGIMTASVVVAGLMCVTLAARILAEEVKWKTLTSLTLVPQSTIWLVFSKVCGAALVLLPSALGFSLGFAIFVWNKEDRLSFWENTSREDMTWMGWMMLQYVLLIHLAALASLFVKWGALPIAIGVQFIALFIIGTTAQSEDGMLAFGAILAVVGVPCLQIWIIDRFGALAAES